MKAIDKPHVARAVATARSFGAVIEGDAKVKFVRMNKGGERFFVLGNDQEPTFAFHPNLAGLLDRLGVNYYAGAHSGLLDFPDAPKPPQKACLKLRDSAEAGRVLAAI
jgi:hypothetical protein